MSVAILIERRGSAASSISLEEWRALVANHSTLRIRGEPWLARNPATNAVISIPVGEADSEVYVDGQWLPFLRWQRGTLVSEYDEELEDPANPIRNELVNVARELTGVLGTDIGDEELAW
jgi:hypothetical protein